MIMIIEELALDSRLPRSLPGKLRLLYTPHSNTAVPSCIYCLFGELAILARQIKNEREANCGGLIISHPFW